MLKILGLYLLSVALGVGVTLLAAAAFYIAGAPWPPSAYTLATFAVTFVIAMHLYKGL